MTWDMFSQFGLAGIIFAGFLCVLKWVFEINNKILMDMADERRRSLEIYTGFIEQLKGLSLMNADFHARVKEDHVLHQQEHQKIIDKFKN